MSSQSLGQCPQCGLIKSSGVMGTVLPQCMCDWKMQPPPTKREWVGLTDEEFDELDKEDLSLRQFVQAIDDRLKEKNR